jgi:hypothetical protein
VRSDLHVTHAIVMSVQPPGLALLTVAGCLHVKCEVNCSFAACTSVLSPVKVPPAWQRRHHPAEEAVHDAGSIGKRLSYDGLHATNRLRCEVGITYAMSWCSQARQMMVSSPP